MNFTSTGTTEPSYQVKYIQDGIQCIAYHSELLVPPPSTNRTDPDQTLPCSMQQKSFKLGPETYVTSPKVFARGDKAFWQHGYGLMSEVEITARNNLTADDSQLYQVKLRTDGSSLQVAHEDLYIPRMMPTKLSRTDAGPPLDAIQRLELQVHPGTSPEQIICFGAMSLSKFKLSSFTKTLSNEVYHDDSALETIRIYDNITLCIQAAHIEGADILPAVDSLTPTSNFKSILLPPTTYQRFHLANQFYIAVGKALKNHLQQPRVNAKAPAVRRAINLAAISNNIDGFELLMAALRHQYHHLGATNRDIKQDVLSLKLKSNDDIYAFLDAAQKIDTTIQRCNITLQPNSLIRQVITPSSHYPTSYACFPPTYSSLHRNCSMAW